MRKSLIKPNPFKVCLKKWW